MNRKLKASAVTGRKQRYAAAPRARFCVRKAWRKAYIVSSSVASPGPPRGKNHTASNSPIVQINDSMHRATTTGYTLGRMSKRIRSLPDRKSCLASTATLDSEFEIAVPNARAHKGVSQIGRAHV